MYIHKKHLRIILCNTCPNRRGQTKRKEWSQEKKTLADQGVPDGYTKETIKPIREKAKQFAEEYVTKKTDISD